MAKGRSRELWEAREEWLKEHSAKQAEHEVLLGYPRLPRDFTALASKLEALKAEAMSDPTYDRAAIDSNPVWQLAFSLSEIQNDDAPIGWDKYIYVAECLLANYDIRRKEDAADMLTGDSE